MTALVVDASVALKWIIEEPGSAEAEALRDHDMAAPSLLRLETANALRTLAARGTIATVEARDLFALLQQAPVTVVDADDRLEARALALALELGHPVYDCLYLALAERMDRLLVTADERFRRALAATPHADRCRGLAEIDRL